MDYFHGYEKARTVIRDVLMVVGVLITSTAYFYGLYNNLSHKQEELQTRLDGDHKNVEMEIEFMKTASKEALEQQKIVHSMDHSNVEKRLTKIEDYVMKIYAMQQESFISEQKTNQVKNVKNN